MNCQLTTLSGICFGKLIYKCEHSLRDICGKMDILEAVVILLSDIMVCNASHSVDVVNFADVC